VTLVTNFYKLLPILYWSVCNLLNIISICLQSRETQYPSFHQKFWSKHIFLSLSNTKQFPTPSVK